MDNMDKIQELRAKVDKDPSSKLFVPLAEEYRKAGMLDEAIAVLKSGLDIQPKFTSGLVALAKIYFDKRMFAEARAELERVIASVPDHMFAQRKLADIYKELGERELAIEQYRKVIKQNPMDEEAQSILEVLSKAPAPAPPPAEAPAAEEELFLPEDEDFLMSLSGEEGVEELSEEETLTPLEEIEAEAEFLEAFEAEAAPVDEDLEAIAEVEEPIEGIEMEAAPVEEAAEEAEAIEAVEEIEELDTVPLEEIAAEAAEAFEEAGAVEEIEPTEAAEEVEAIEAVEEVEAIEAAEEVEVIEAVEEVEAIEAAEEVEAIEAVEEVEAIEAAEEVEAIEAVEEPEALEEVMAAPQERDVFAEAGFDELAQITKDETGNEQHLAQEYISKGQYAKAINVYKEMLARDPKNVIAKQGLHELEALMKLIGSEKEVIIARLEAFMRAITKRKNELYRNA